MKMKYTKEFLEPIVAKSTSWSSLLRNIGIGTNGGNFRGIQMRVNQHNIDTSHFTGQGWAKGLTTKSNPIIKQISEKRQWSNDKIFRKNSGYPHSKLRKKMLDSGEWIYECSICKLVEWLNKPITLHVDHIDGCSWNHERSNLRFLCANCHSQTNTYGNGTSKYKQSTTPVKQTVSKSSKVSKVYKCTNCSKDICKQTKTGLCAECSHINSRKVIRPSKEQLKIDIMTLPMTRIGKKYNVSDKAICKWLIQYDLPYKRADITALKIMNNLTFDN